MDRTRFCAVNIKALYERQGSERIKALSLARTLILRNKQVGARDVMRWRHDGLPRRFRPLMSPASTCLETQVAVTAGRLRIRLGHNRRLSSWVVKWDHEMVLMRQQVAAVGQSINQSTVCWLPMICRRPHDGSHHPDETEMNCISQFCTYSGIVQFCLHDAKRLQISRD